MKIHYLEVVTDNVDITCTHYESIHSVSFGEPDVRLGNARVAELKGGSLIGIRATMSDQEKPVIRPYFLVSDIDAAIDLTLTMGAILLHPALEIPDLGQFAIYELGGIQYGLWQL